jgi:hypothetical protein
LAIVTALHSVSLKTTRLEARVLEADGSASVAENPIMLFLVVSNGGTSDYVGHVWELSKGVSKVRTVKPSACGIELLVDRDVLRDDNRAYLQEPHVLSLCFLGPDGALADELHVVDRPARRKKLK